MRKTRSVSFLALRLTGVLALLAVPVSRALAQQPTTATGSIGGVVATSEGVPLGGVQIIVDAGARGAVSRADGQYLVPDVPAGSHVVRARLVGYRPLTFRVEVVAAQRATQNFNMVRDPLSLGAVVVTGTVTPRENLESSVAVSTMTPQLIEQAAPRSTTEMLRYVPGFTRVESSGGEVNQNISIRGVLGVEYVMFMEDGLPVFPTMHTFFMNADNLFRPDENIEQLEVVRGGSSALFGSNTPGAIVNFISKTGGPQLGGTMRASAGTEGLARYDLNVNGPLGDDWRFNVGGFYRYDHGVRDPGFPGIQGGQLKANITRLLDNGYVRISGKLINDRNQFILPLPFRNPDDPEYVPGFGDYGAMSTNEGLGLRVPIPIGELELPLDDGLRTQAGWLTADAAFELGGDWRLQNTAQVMRNDQSWNAIVPFDVMPASDFVTRPVSAGGLGFPEGTPFAYTFTNHPDAAGVPLPFDTPNGLVSPSGQWHVEKPMSAFQDQLQLRRTFGASSTTLGVYFANYSQDNRWFFTDILLDVRDNPRFLDLAVGDAATGGAVNVTSNGFRRFLSNYVNGSGQATVFSAFLGGDVAVTDRLRVDAGVRWEYNDFVQSTENTSPMDIDGDSATQFDVEPWGNGSFRHFSRNLNDWAASLGVNYRLTDEVSFYATGGRSYKMPALDEFLNAVSAEQVALFDSREVRNVEGGVKYGSPRLGATLNGFYVLLKNIVGQGAVLDPVTGRTTWVILSNPENRSYGAELELSGTPVRPLLLQATGTWLKAELGSGAGADIGSWINGVPEVIGNLAATYTYAGLRFTADWHYVGSRFADVATGTELPDYNYFNFGAAYTLSEPRLTITADLLNAFQSKGLEEGNPRLTLLPAGRTSDLFLARPLLPRRVLLSLRYDY